MSTSKDIATIRALQANAKTLSELNINQARTIAEQQKRIKELKASRKEALEYLQREGTPYVNAAIAALQENEL